MYGHAQTSGYRYVNSSVNNHTTYNSASKVTIFKSQAFINDMNLVLCFSFTRSHVKKATLVSSYHILALFTPTLCLLHRLLMQRLKLNSRIITILGVLFSMIGLILMADWQSIPPDPCTDFSLYHHPEIANNLSHSLRPCLTSPSGCQWPTNDGTVQNVSAAEDNMAVIESILEYVEIPDSSVRNQGPGPVLHVSVYNVAMNVCESLRESKHHCHWIPRSIVTGTLCADCPSICRGTDHILNFIQFTIGAFIFRITIPISRIAIMIVISDVISKDYQVS